MRSLLLALLGAATLLSATPALADQKPLVVLELFTSQGCSSCPPADALIEELAGRDDVLPLALHVDYWDYIGWADSFAKPQYTVRQKAYAHMAGEGTIYTPQIVIGGIDHVIGYKPMQVADLLQSYRAAPEPVEIDAEANGTTLTINCLSRDGAALPADITVDLVSFTPQAVVDIEHGENAGETITYANIVTSWEQIGNWDGQGELSLTATIPADGPLAIIVQESGPGRVLGAVRLR